MLFRMKTLFAFPVLAFTAVCSLLFFSCKETSAAESADAMPDTTLSLLPSQTSRDFDIQAASLFVSAKEVAAVSEKRRILNEALSLSGISHPVRTMLEKELSLAVEPPKAEKPRTSFQAVSIPKQKTASRYGVNMNELMKTVTEAGITKDPFAQ